MSLTAEDFTLDLDAAEREAGFPDGIPIVRKGKTFLAPSELPLDVFDPLLKPELGIAAIIKEALASEDDTTDAIVEIILSRPTIPLEVRDAFYDSIRLLLGAEQYEEWAATRPGLRTYVSVVKHLARVYGVGLGEAFSSPAPSEDGGGTSKPTSPDTSTETPESSSDAPEPATAS